MSGKYGADVEQLRRLAKQFDSAAGKLSSARGEIASKMASSPWKGPDAARFKADWSSSQSRQLVEVSGKLREAAKALRRNADEQSQASSAEGGAIGGSSGIVGTGGSSSPTNAHAPGSSGADRPWWAGLSSITSDAINLTSWLGTKAEMITAELAKTIPGFGKATRVIKVGGKVLGVIGVGLGAWDTVKEARNGKWTQAALLGGVTAAGAAVVVLGAPISVTFAVGAAGYIISKKKDAIAEGINTGIRKGITGVRNGAAGIGSRIRGWL